MSLHLFPAKPNQSRSSAVPRLLVLKNQESNRHNPKGKGGVVPMGHVQSTESSENYPGPAQQRGRLRREEETRGQTSRARAFAGRRFASSSSLCSRRRYWTRRSRRDGEQLRLRRRRGEEAGRAWWSAASKWLAGLGGGPRPF